MNTGIGITRQLMRFAGGVSGIVGAHRWWLNGAIGRSKMQV